jgi:hypothetical protein
MMPKFYKHVTLKPSLNQWGAAYFKNIVQFCEDGLKMQEQR